MYLHVTALSILYWAFISSKTLKALLQASRSDSVATLNQIIASIWLIVSSNRLPAARKALFKTVVATVENRLESRTRVVKLL